MNTISETTPAIQIRQLKKSYGQNRVLHGIDLDIYPGQVIGYIGPNGAGKSTTVRILVGLDRNFEGSVMVGGLDVQKESLKVKKRVGYVPENAELYDVLTPREFLTFVGRLQEMPQSLIDQRMTSMLGFFSLQDHIDERMDTFSKGMRQKVLFISGLMHDPQIIFFDEPLSGLDANSVIMVKEIIARLADQGKTIFYCSHMMDVVEKISDRIILIGNGRILADGTFDALKAEGGETLEQVFSQLTGQEDIQQKAADFLNSLNGEEGE